VPGLSPGDVAVIDGTGGLISGSDDGAIAPDTQEKVAELRARVERLLAARVGVGNSVVEVSVDTVMETESIIERRFDPETRVAISTEVQESSTSSQDSMTGDVTIASNLPEGDGAGNSGAATNENTESRSVTNYEVSETSREILRSPGAVRRISVAVLVNGVESVDENGTPVLTPRPTEELEDLKLLVASAVGFDGERGDEITIRSMAFETLPELGTAAGDPIDLPAAHSGVAVSPLAGGTGGVIDGIASATILPTNAGQLGGDNVGGADIGAEDDPVQRLRGLIDDRRDEAIQVLQSWIDDPDAEPVK